MISVPITFRFFSLLFFLLLSSSVFADETNNKKAKVLTVTPASISMEVGQTGILKVKRNKGKVTVTSGNSAIVKATYKRKKVSLKGLQIGQTVITIKDKKSTQEIPVVISAVTNNHSADNDDSEDSDDDRNDSDSEDHDDNSGSPQGLQVSPNNVSMLVGSNVILNISNTAGTVSVESGENSIVRAVYANNTVTLTGLKAGSTTVTVRDRYNSKEIPVTVTLNEPPVASADFTLLSWNDLGMHCVDGKDYSIFSILPPYNNLHAQLIDKNGQLVTQGVQLSYKSVADNNGEINTISSTKTNFWDYVLSLFGGNPAPDIGLNLSGEPGNPTPNLEPAPMTYNAMHEWFEAEGIPMMPYTDNGNKDFYPMVEVEAKNAAGESLAKSITVLPISDEITCKACHSSIVDNSNPAAIAARPANGWLFDSDLEKDWKRNILKLHDENQNGSSLFEHALEQNGYLATGLIDTVDSGQPILCAACHGSNALAAPGIAGIPPLTQVLHTKHAQVIDPETQLSLNDSENRASCYRCHPGAVTQCLRGAMGNAVDNNGDSLMSCQSCHGNMEQVGSSEREGWFDEPTCQSCHHDGIRETVGVNTNGIAKVWADTNFASNPDTPAPGLDLFRFSTGHGNLQCEACHGATHAIYPSSHERDNIQSIALQGHAGVVNECSACHSSVPLTKNGGPHGMHSTGNIWVDRHERYAEDNNAADCAYCHGADFRGSPLSEIKMDKTFEVEHEIISFTAGHQVGCYDCHNGPNP